MVPIRLPDWTSMELMTLAEVDGRSRLSAPRAAVLPDGRISLKTMSGAPVISPL